MSPELWHRILCAELSAAKCRELGEVLGTSDLSLDQVLSLPFLTATDRARIRNANVEQFAEYEVGGVSVLAGAGLPPVLLESEYPPLALYCWGDASALRSPTIAIVGTRKAGTYGKLVARKFASEFAAAGVTVVSGGALGVDAAAHEGAMEAEGKTVGVLITGIEQVYPRMHGGLFQRIRQSGCLISQFPLGTKAAWEYRPLQRNRTIAMLSQAVLVVEAPLSSGSLTTAAEAAELGRPVFVVPGPIDNLNYQGSHLLIREGAILADHPHQILHSLGITPGTKRRAPAGASGPAAMILRALQDKPLSPEMLAEKTGLPHSEVLSELTTMELEGLLLCIEGKYARPL